MTEETFCNIRDETRAALNEINLPSTVGTFTLKETFDNGENIIELFDYVSDERHCTITSYFDGATSEYKVRVRLGLNEWCLTRFFNVNVSRFIKNLRAELDRLIERFDNKFIETNAFIDELNLNQWNYGAELPATINNFDLFIKPAAPVEVTNGSFIIINYVDFARARDVAIYYNIFSDEFSAEARDGGHTHVLYDFDAKNLTELTEKLTNHLSNCLN